MDLDAEAPASPQRSDQSPQLTDQDMEAPDQQVVLDDSVDEGSSSTTNQAPEGRPKFWGQDLLRSFTTTSFIPRTLTLRIKGPRPPSDGDSAAEPPTAESDTAHSAPGGTSSNGDGPLHSSANQQPVSPEAPKAFIDLTSGETGKKKRRRHNHRSGQEVPSVHVNSSFVDLCEGDDESARSPREANRSPKKRSESALNVDDSDHSGEFSGEASVSNFIDLDDETSWYSSSSTSRPARKSHKRKSSDEVEESPRYVDSSSTDAEDNSLAILDDVGTSSSSDSNGAAPSGPSAHADRLLISSTVVRPFRCPVCLEDIEKGGQVCLLGCEHRLCFDCATQFVLTKVQDAKVTREELICPLPDCKRPLSVSEVRGCLAEEEEALSRYEDFSIKRYLEKEKDSFFCPTPGCPFVAEAGGNPHMAEFECPSCKVKFCLACKHKWHPGSTCEQAKMFAEASKEDKQFFRKAKRSGMKQCPKCKFWVEKSEGCNAMLCRCGTTFCWRCGDDVNKDSGCSCLRNVESLSSRERADVLQINAHATNRNNPAHQQLQERLIGQNQGLGLAGLGGAHFGHAMQNPMLAAALQLQMWNLQHRGGQQRQNRVERPRERREPWRPHGHR